MLAVISQGDATVIVGLLVLIGTILTVLTQIGRNRRMELEEHAATHGKLDVILQNQEGIRKEVHFIRADVTDIHGAITELRRADHDTDARVTRLERTHPEGNDAA
jgi:hypothetical protein